MITIASEWGSFAAAVLPADASDTQRQEMRRAFYAGWRSALAVTGTIAASQPEAEAVRQVEALDREVMAFAVAVMMGHA